MAQSPPAGPADVQVSVIYTGRSLGALGTLNDPREHEILLAQAEKAGVAVRFDTYSCWRSANAVLFSPVADVSQGDLEEVIQRRGRTDASTRRGTLRSNNVTLVPDPAGGDALLQNLLDDPRAPLDFPDLVRADATVSRVQGAGGVDRYLVVEDGGEWPPDPAAWVAGVVHRIEIGGRIVYELPVNLGQIGPRATIVARAVAEVRSRGARPVVVDLGHREGDLGLDRAARARIDYAAITAMGYTIVVPYELELSLKRDGLAALQAEFPDIRFLAANVRTTLPSGELLRPQWIVDVDGAKVGFFGIVDPDLKGVLAKASLQDFTFESPVEAAARATAGLRAAGADAVVMLSNLHPRDNALVAREVAGIDAIVADLHVRWSPESVVTSVELPGRPRTRPGSPALQARGFANGLGVGVLSLGLRRGEGGRTSLVSLSHSLESVTDRVPADRALVADVRALVAATDSARGQVLVPAFSDLAAHRPSLRSFDATAGLGRISKRMWEEFLARVLRYKAGAEVSIIRKLPHFPPAVGALHEAEVRSWLWTEDAIVAMDVTGEDLRKILAEDTRGDLVTSGIDTKRGLVNGRRVLDTVFYRVATTDLLFEGARFRAFERARRVVRTFRVAEDGTLRRARGGQAIALRDFILGELVRQAAMGTEASRIDTLARLLDRDAPFERLYTFAFDRPTVFGSFNQSANNDAYGRVPDSRVAATDSSVLGVTGRYVLSSDLQRVGLDAGLVAEYARQAVVRGGSEIITEPRDNLEFDFTVRRKPPGETVVGFQPFLRGIYDTEFTPTVDPQRGVENPREQFLKGVGGVRRVPTRRIPILEVGGVVKDDLASGRFEGGMAAVFDYRREIGPLGRLTYRLHNDLEYYFPTGRDDATNLSLAYNMVHEILVPLVDELSLSLGVDLYLFRGKVPETSRLGSSTILRVGLAYDRLWKPKYQPFF